MLRPTFQNHTSRLNCKVIFRRLNKNNDDNNNTYRQQQQKKSIHVTIKKLKSKLNLNVQSESIQVSFGALSTANLQLSANCCPLSLLLPILK